jgi:hypothetical protein
MDTMLRDFLVDSGLVSAESTGRDGKPRPRGAAGVKTEGVLIGCQTCPENSISHAISPVPATATEASEEDELIWWAWDGKLTGFTEW